MAATAAEDKMERKQQQEHTHKSLNLLSAI